MTGPIDPGLPLEKPPSPRELDALRAYWQEGSIGRAAAALHLSYHTVRRHLQDMRGRYGLHTSMELIRAEGSNYNQHERRSSGSTLDDGAAAAASGGGRSQAAADPGSSRWPTPVSSSSRPLHPGSSPARSPAARTTPGARRVRRPRT